MFTSSKSCTRMNKQSNKQIGHLSTECRKFALVMPYHALRLLKKWRQVSTNTVKCDYNPWAYNFIRGFRWAYKWGGLCPVGGGGLEAV